MPEVIWSGIPLMIAIGIFLWGAALFAHMKTPPDAADALEINVIGKQWMWNVQHPEGHRELNELHVPVGRTVRLVMTSQDVIHDFGIPAFRTKQDVVPGRYTTQWFKATKPGRYHLFCDQLCGMGHAEMVGWVTVMTPVEYNEWINAGGAQASLVARGERLFRSLGCSGCHGENALIRAPSLVGLYGHPVPLERTTDRDRHGRRPVHARLHPAAAETDRRQLRSAERHAYLRGADRRGGGFPVDPVHQEPRPTTRRTNTCARTSGVGGQTQTHRSDHAGCSVQRDTRPGRHAFARRGLTHADASPTPAYSRSRLPIEMSSTATTYLNEETSIRSWLLTTDHKRIGLLYLFTILIFFTVAAFAAALMRLELLTPKGDSVLSETYNKLFTIHGVLMVWFFLIPVDS